MGNNEKGFTLMEMLVVLFIIGVILAIAIPSLAKTGDSAQEQAEKANIKILTAQAENYRLVEGEYPDDVEALKSAGYIHSDPKCPDGSDFSFQTSTDEDNDRETITISCDDGGS